MEERTCERHDCGTTYVPGLRAGQQNYCSPRCQKLDAARRLAAKLPPVGHPMPGRTSQILTCDACGDEFDNAIRRSTSSTRHCTSRCFEWARQHPGRSRPPGRACEACGHPITRAGARTCGSRRCMGWVKQHPGEPLPASRTCPGCGSSVPGDNLRQIYCDSNCRWWAVTHPGVLRPSKRSCRTCDSDISGHGSRALYCSDECYYKHPDQLAKARAETKRRRVRLRGGPTAPFTDEQLRERLSMYCGRCYICGDPGSAVDHVKPIREGGLHGLANFRPICRSCNSCKGELWPLPIDLILRVGTPDERKTMLRNARKAGRLSYVTRRARKAADLEVGGERTSATLGSLPRPRNAVDGRPPDDGSPGPRHFPAGSA